MSKRIIYIGSPCILNTKDEQLQITNTETGEFSTVPIQDMEYLVCDNFGISLSGQLITKLMVGQVAILWCNFSHLPCGLMIPEEGNYLQGGRIQMQAELHKSTKKKIWKQVIESKIYNQMKLLQKRNKNWQALERILDGVKTGDSSNAEAQAAKQYWKELFDLPSFKRSRDGDFPNNFLNFGYAIIRGLVARNLVTAGLCTSLGVFHKNAANNFALADDIMEPYRPFIDEAICDFMKEHEHVEVLAKSQKAYLLNITQKQICLGKENKTIHHAIHDTCKSLVKVMSKKTDKILYPKL